MSHLNPGLISAYNSLTDKHLAGYFSNTRIRRHLQRAGLITRSGRIVPDKEYRHRLSQRQHQRHVRECLAQAVFHKVLEMERAHQIEIKQRLEEFAKRERVHKIKLQRSNRYEEDFVCALSPRPPKGARLTRKQRSAPEGDRSGSSESLGSSRPNTAPGEMQRPVRLKPIHSKHPRASLGRSSPSRPPNPPKENHQPLGCTMESRRRLTGLEASGGISPYCLPVINTFVTPVPPPPKRKELGPKVTPSSAHRGRRLRVSTLAPAYEDPPMLRSSVHQSRVSVNMIYFGKKVHLAHDLHDTRDEVKVYQQHCGGENLCVYKVLMLETSERFQFVSRRHRGFPFSLTFFLNGLQVERLSSCCEFKHRRASRLGGRHRHFGFCSVEGASPCYKCIIAIGLDKQPNPPPKREKLAEAVLKESQYSSEPEAPTKKHVDVKKKKPEENTGDSKEATEETPAGGSHPTEEAESTSLCAGPENKMEEKSSENQEETEAKDVEQNDEVGQEAKSSEEVQARDEVEEKPEDKDKEKQTDPNEMGDGDNSEERKEEEKTKSELITGGNEDEKNDTADGKTDRSQKTNEGEDSKSVKDESEEEEKEAIDNNTQQDRVSTPEVKDRLENHRPVSRGSPEHQPELDRPDL
uniref:Glutamate-rich 3 n=1 Tax=Tetraodon nigroviridis TaxID=99883 RepID=H3CZD0_TETNG